MHRLQLHPAYSYEDFIRALHISNGGGTEYRAGYLPQLIDDIERQPRAERLPHVLILDEMNRTDLSRMLGECFSLLEDRNQTIDLPARDRNGAAMRLRIPDDLFVIGTMNLIDQSIEQIEGQLKYLSRQVAMSSVHITLTQEVVSVFSKDEWRPWAVVKNAFRETSRDFTRFIDAVLVFLVMLPEGFGTPCGSRHLPSDGNTGDGVDRERLFVNALHDLEGRAT